MKKAILFDLFYTLADPRTELVTLESDPLGISPEEWSRVFWTPALGRRRALGEFASGADLIEEACKGLPFQASAAQKAGVLKGRLTRMARALTDLRPGILETIAALRARGLKLALVSNADIIDIEAWDESPLVSLFDTVIFSCSVRLVKPEPEIYRLALERLGASPEEAVFVGDGGDHELDGAKAVGLTTVWTEYLQKKDAETRALIRPFADYHIDDIRQLPEILENL